MLTQDVLLDSLDGAVSGCRPGPRWHMPAPTGGSSSVKARASPAPRAAPVA